MQYLYALKQVHREWRAIVPLVTVRQAPHFFPQSSVISSQLTSTITYYHKLPDRTVLCLQPESALRCMLGQVWTSFGRCNADHMPKFAPCFQLLPMQNKYIAEHYLPEMLGLQTRPAASRSLQASQAYAVRSVEMCNT